MTKKAKSGKVRESLLVSLASLAVTILLVATVTSNLRRPPTLRDAFTAYADYVEAQELQSSRGRNPFFTKPTLPARQEDGAENQTSTLIDYRDSDSQNETGDWIDDINVPIEGSHGFYPRELKHHDFILECLKKIEAAFREGSISDAQNWLADVHSSNFCQWDPFWLHDIRVQWEIQTVIANQSALLLNHPGRLTSDEALDRIRRFTAEWAPSDAWGATLLNRRRDILDGVEHSFYFYPNGRNRSRFLSELRKVLLAAHQCSLILDSAAGDGKEPWTSERMIKSIDIITESTKRQGYDYSNSNQNRYYDAYWDIYADRDMLTPYHEWRRTISLYRLYLAVLKRKVVEGTLPIQLNDTIAKLQDRETQKDLAPLNPSLVSWKWNLGEKIAIKYTSPDGHVTYWPEAPPK